jgi:hypothetical protein
VQLIANMNVSQISPEDLRAAVAVAIAAGTLYCFLGYRVLKVVLVLTGFLLAGSAAAAGMAWVTQGKVAYMVVAAVFAGVAGALILLLVYRLGVVCLGVLGGVTIAHTILSGRADDWVVSAIVGTAVFGGLCGLFMERLIMTVATAAIGAWMLVYGIAFFILAAGTAEATRTAFVEPETIRTLLLCWVLVAAAGAIAQFMTHRPAESA